MPRPLLPPFPCPALPTVPSLFAAKAIPNILAREQTSQAGGKPTKKNGGEGQHRLDGKCGDVSNSTRLISGETIKLYEMRD